jgi:hypothetical protein
MAVVEKEVARPDGANAALAVNCGNAGETLEAAATREERAADTDAV